MSCCCDCCACDSFLEMEQSNVDCFSEPAEPLTTEQRDLVEETLRDVMQRIRLLERAEAMQRAIS